MDRREDVTDKGDQYAKRMLDRKKEHGQSSQYYSKSLRRRLSIMRAINKSNITPPSDFHYEGNPFEKEFANTSESITMYKEAEEGNLEPTRRPENSRHGFSNDLSSRTYRIDSLPSDRELCSTGDSSTCDKSPTDTNSEHILDYRHPPSQITRGLLGECDSCGNPDDEPLQEPICGTRLSIGEYFGAASHGELNACTQHIVSEKYEDEFEEMNGQLQHRGPDLFFGARVLEILEPEVVKVERVSAEPRVSNRRRASDMTFIQETFKGLQLENPDESLTTSLMSEDMKELDREMEKLDFQSNDVSQQSQQSQQIIVETPKRMYPNLSLVKRMSNNFSSDNLYYVNDGEKNDNMPGTDFNSNLTETFYDFEKPSIAEKESFATPMTMPDSQLKNLKNYNRHESSQSGTLGISFLKRNASFILNNLHVPKVMRRKPNLESTRKIYNGEGKIASPRSQEESSISTLTLPNTPSSPDGYESLENPQQEQQHQRQQQQLHTQMQKSMNATLPYEVENFLELALGDERYNSTITYANSDTREINASELISEEIMQNMTERKKVMRIPTTDQPKHSSTLNRTLSIYKTLTQRIKKKFRGSVKDETKSMCNQEILPSNVNPELRDNVKKLLDEVELQQTLIYQASKALELCNSMREFIASSERVESERLLVLASLRKKAALEEIRRMIGQTCDIEPCRERAEVILKELSLQLREDVLRRERQNGDIVEWFVVVISEGLTVWATHAVACPISSPRLYFPGQLLIPSLKPDFRLSLRVYSLKLQQILYNHEDKYHITQSIAGTKNSSCPISKKLLKRSWRAEKKKSAISPKQYEIRFSGVKESAFVMCGSIDFVLQDLSLSSPWPLTRVPTKSVLQGTIDLSLSCRLQLSTLHAGFLTHGDEAGGLAAWNRRWCVLEGHNLLFWNYPREQGCKPPLYAIDLVNCVSRHIGLIDRSLCARTRTLLVETIRRRNAIDRDSILVECHSTCTILRNLLSCDTNQDLIEWQSKLNHVVSALREWNIINTKSLPEVSDL
ncbi:PREDICTED: anillin-like protein 1 [Ceratosolen solmsi marchali]|uniref:Anillin-like protein 1 n=1 Tax=Ceratosolen solmsi marchali TaxID=326594 RepID=A0AAJ6YR25_9HYME|nr:PREDICTED: anillin-like protein 1 [Ceratosolen solmsi marchali]